MASQIIYCMLRILTIKTIKKAKNIKLNLSPAIYAKPLFIKISVFAAITIAVVLSYQSFAVRPLYAEKTRSRQIFVWKEYCKEYFFVKLNSRGFYQGDAIYINFQWKPEKGLRVPQRVIAYWEHIRMPLKQSKAKPQEFSGLIGISPKKNAGLRFLRLNVHWDKSVQGKSMRSYTVPVRTKKYDFAKTFVRLTVNRKYTTRLSKEKKIEIKKQWRQKIQALRTKTNRKWQGSFLDPRNFAPVTSSFFHRRYYNTGTRSSPHSGVDLKGAYGTPIRAMNQGKIVLSANFYYEGNIVIVDHGHGILTLYKHLNERAVAQNDIVQKGQLLGYVGSTGLSTGPHLHLSFYIQGSLYSPLSLIDLPVGAEE